MNLIILLIKKKITYHTDIEMRDDLLRIHPLQSYAHYRPRVENLFLKLCPKFVESAHATAHPT